MAGKPSFLRDPDQAAELAALLEDVAEQLEREPADRAMTRSELARHAQTIARYRRWATELVAAPEQTAPAPVQIRPATRHTEEATG